MSDSPIVGTKGQPPIWRAALLGLCPECGARTLYAGLLNFAPRCTACGLDFSRFNVGDGPAALLVLLVGAIAMPAVLALHFYVQPPVWIELILWPIVVVGMTIGGLRLSKAGLIAAEHQREGREGRIADPADGLDP